MITRTTDLKSVSVYHFFGFIRFGHGPDLLFYLLKHVALAAFQQEASAADAQIALIHGS